MNKNVLVISFILILVLLTGTLAYKSNNIIAENEKLTKSVKSLELQVNTLNAELNVFKEKDRFVNKDIDSMKEDLLYINDTLKIENGISDIFAYRTTMLFYEALFKNDLSELNKLLSKDSADIIFNYKGKQLTASLQKLNMQDDITKELVKWIQSEELVLEPPCEFINRYGGAHNLIIKLPQGHLWVQYNTKAEITKLGVYQERPEID